MVPRNVSHYEIVEKIGEGGMGVVYKARDTRLDRYVALKFLPPHVGLEDQERLRFLNEARAASALEHPNVCSIHDIEKTGEGQVFIVMPCYEGETLLARMRRGPMPVAAAVDVARQVAAGLGRAHARGIVHRDIKPSNIFLTSDGLVKILDFGVAKVLDETGVTRTGTTIGTIGYMSPEQTRGEAADQRADVWAVGVLLYEMLTGRAAFPGEHAGVILQGILTGAPKPLSAERPDVPASVAAIVERALSKDRSARFADANELGAALAPVEADLRAPAAVQGGPFLRPIVAIPVALIAVLAIVALAWTTYRSGRARWARNEGLPQIAKLVAERNYIEAAALATQAQAHIPNDPVLQQLWNEIAVSVSIESTPEGAEVFIRPYAQPSAPERRLGVTPLPETRLARGSYRWRFSKAGYETVERAAEARDGRVQQELPAAGTVPEGMIKVPHGAEVMMIAAFGLPTEIALGDYFIQRYEVTNRDFKKFVDAGGYRRREFWKHPFIRDGRKLSWEEATALFVDQARQPGPATWEVGAYPSGKDDLPVGGVSWFEATAYAEFAGLSLPTVHHWYRAGGVNSSPYVMPLANFDREGPVPVGQSGAMSPFGAYDMAGNVREWTWNENELGLRYTLGGGWGEPHYMFGEPEPRSPFDRSPVNGFRCAKYGGGGPDERSAAPLVRRTRDYRNAKPVSDETFAVYARLHQYDPIPLDARVERTTQSPEGWRIERVSFTAAYGGERVVAYLWLPAHVQPPYQTIVIFPGSEALTKSASEQLEQPGRYDFLVRSGRAVVHPVYHGMYERFQPLSRGDFARRDVSIRWSQDVRRTVDYLASRSEIDLKRLAYFGSSLGAGFAPVPLAVEKRFTLAVLVGGGFTSAPFAPEVLALNYAPRVNVPFLLLSGRHDYFLPYNTSQKPFFDLMGTPIEHKRHVTVEAGHSVPRTEYLREVLGWLDKYFGAAR